jgi:hypothetical protein
MGEDGFRLQAGTCTSSFIGLKAMRLDNVHSPLSILQFRRLFQTIRNWAGMLLLVMAVSGCVDNWKKKTVLEPYYLEKSGENFYYLQRKGHEVEGVGILEGTVEQIGWSNSTILAYRNPCYGGDHAGWMVIDTITHKIVGPISDSERQKSYKTIPCFTVQVAWDKM